MQRAIDGKEALQRQLHAAKSSGISAGGGDQSVLSLMKEFLMIQVDEYKNKASNTQTETAKSVPGSNETVTHRPAVAEEAAVVNCLPEMTPATSVEAAAVSLDATGTAARRASARSCTSKAATAVEEEPATESDAVSSFLKLPFARIMTDTDPGAKKRQLAA